jgi:hypothetical protein
LLRPDGGAQKTAAPADNDFYEGGFYYELADDQE